MLTTCAEDYSSFQNTVFNGVAFWDLSEGQGADLQVDNGQGCVHLVGEQIGMNDVRLNSCGPRPDPRLNPAPMSAVIALLGAMICLGGSRGRRG